MPNYTPESIALINASHYDPLWENVGHIHRKIDGKFQLVDEALQVMEARSNSFYPSVTKINKHQISITAALDITVTGVNFSADEAEISVTVGSLSAAITAGASTTSFHATLLISQTDDLGAAGDTVMVVIRVGGVLAASIPLPLVA